MRNIMFKHALSQAVSWFQIHAEQRLKLMNFFVILLGGTLALLGAAMKDSLYLLEIVTGGSIAVITLTFKNLDRRTSSLVKIAESALKKLEEQIADNLNMSEIKLVAISDVKNGILSYRECFNFLFALGYGIAAVAIMHGVWNILKSYCPFA